MTRLYFAYGSNMNPEQMEFRCPGARSLGGFKLPNWQLVFRMVADIEPADGAEVHGVIWEISDEHEQALDEFEGVGSGTYYKDFFTVMTPEGERDVLTYLMNSEGIFPPTEAYYRRIVAGYRAHGLKFKTLREAKDRAHDDRNPSYIERQRYRRAGQPRLAERTGWVEPVHGNLKPPRDHSRDSRESVSLAPADDFGMPESVEPKASVKDTSGGRQNLSDWLEERRHSGRGY